MNKGSRKPVLGVGCVHPGADYTAAEAEWLKALASWKARKGPRPGPADLLEVLAGLGYRRPEGGGTPREVEAALDRQRIRLARKQGRRRPFLTACDVLQALIELGYRRGG